MCQVQNDFSGGGRAQVKGQEAEREGCTSLYFAKSRRQRCHVGKEEPNTEGRVKKKGNTFYKELFFLLMMLFSSEGDNSVTRQRDCNPEGINAARVGE